MHSESTDGSTVRRRRVWAGILVAMVALVGLIALFAALFVWLTFPPKLTPGRVDVVIVMAGAADGRHEIGEHLVSSGVADNLVVSNPLGARDRAGYGLCAGSQAPERVETWCMDPVPSTTTGEAQTFEVLAQKEGWNTAVAVTNRPHHHRVNLNLDRCTSVDATVVNIDYINWEIAPYQVAREVGGFLKFWAANPC